MTTRIVTFRIYGLDDTGTGYWLARRGGALKSDEPLTLIQFWDDRSRGHIQWSFESLLSHDPVHSIMTSFEFDPPWDPRAKDQPPPRLWPTTDRDLTRDWFREYVLRLDPTLSRTEDKNPGTLATVPNAAITSSLLGAETQSTNHDNET